LSSTPFTGTGREYERNIKEGKKEKKEEKCNFYVGT